MADVSAPAPETVKVGDAEYRLGKLDLFSSLEVSRLAAPTLPILFSGVIEGFLHMWQEKSGASESAGMMDELVMVLSVSKPLLDQIAAMPKEQFDSIVSTCLSCVEKKRGKLWSPVIKDGVPFDDLSAGDSLILTLRVLIREIRPIGAAFFGMASSVKA